MLIDLAFADPVAYFAIVAVVVGSIVLHELGHALCATWQGDPTPKMFGQLSFNPLRFMPWWGLGLIAVIGIGYGATRVQPRNFRDRRYGDALVSFAGPAVNVGLVLLGAVLYAVSQNSGVPDLLVRFWYLVVLLNVVLFLFNMIPAPPLDGFTVADRLIGLGEFGQMMRRNQPWPLLAALILASNFGLFEISQNLTWRAIEMFGGVN